MGRRLVCVLLLIFLLAACGKETGHRQGHTSAEYATFYPVLLEYFHYRKQAVIHQDVEQIWQRYPDLREGRDARQGINAEQEWVGSFRSLKPFDGNFDLEHYEQFAVRWQGDRAEVTVHGQELYLWRQVDGLVSLSGGEFMLTLFLQKRGGGWTIVKTDEVTLAEWHQK